MFRELFDVLQISMLSLEWDHYLLQWSKLCEVKHLLSAWVLSLAHVGSRDGPVAELLRRWPAIELPFGGSGKFLKLDGLETTCPCFQGKQIACFQRDIF